MSIITRFVVGAILATTAVPAVATVIDFDTLPGGNTVADITPISNQYASLGVVFSGVLGSDTSLVPGATNYANSPPSGPFHSGNYLGNASRAELFVTSPTFQLVPRYDILRISFLGTANNISLSLNNFSLVGTTTFNAYDAAGVLLQTFTTNAGTGWSTRSLTASNVARLDLLNNMFNGSPTYFGIDNLNFTLNATSGVPEPTSWMLMIAGFGLMGASLRTRRQSATITFA